MHTLGAFAVIIDFQSRVLLCHRTDQDAWNLPGGRVEPGESPWEAVVREVNEETGLVVRVTSLLGVYSVAYKSEVVFSFSCVQVGGTLLECSAEATSLAWFAQDALPASTLPRHLMRIRDAFSESRIALMSQL
jgi:mutator protein MutT